MGGDEFPENDQRGDGKLGGQHGWPGCAMPPVGQGNTLETGQVEDMEDVVVVVVVVIDRARARDSV